MVIGNEMRLLKGKDVLTGQGDCEEETRGRRHAAQGTSSAYRGQSWTVGTQKGLIVMASDT